MGGSGRKWKKMGRGGLFQRLGPAKLCGGMPPGKEFCAWPPPGGRLANLHYPAVAVAQPLRHPKRRRRGEPGSFFNPKEHRVHKNMKAFKTDGEVKSFCDRVRQTSWDIHAYHGPGHLEKVYENALAHRLRKAGLVVGQQEPIRVYDEDGTAIGDYHADILVEGWLILELKAVKLLAPEHTAQIMGYLKSARLQHGLLINFGSFKFEIKKYAL